MNINYKQPQFELFPGNSSADADAARPRYLLANLTLSVENLVVLLILGIMVAVFAYSLGVERGKHVMASEFKRSALLSSTPVMDGRPVSALQTPMVSTATATVSQAPVSTNAVAVPAPAKPETAPIAVNTVQKPAAPVTFKYTIQVASYVDSKFAQRAATDLNKNGFETLVLQKGKYAILCVGKFNQKNEAMSVISKLKSKYKDCLVRSM